MPPLLIGVFTIPMILQKPLKIYNKQTKYKQRGSFKYRF